MLTLSPVCLVAIAAALLPQEVSNLSLEERWDPIREALVAKESFGLQEASHGPIRFRVEEQLPMKGETRVHKGWQAWGVMRDDYRYVIGAESGSVLDARAGILRGRSLTELRVEPRGNGLEMTGQVITEFLGYGAPGNSTADGHLRSITDYGRTPTRQTGLSYAYFPERFGWRLNGIPFHRFVLEGLVRPVGAVKVGEARCLELAVWADACGTAPGEIPPRPPIVVTIDESKPYLVRVIETCTTSLTKYADETPERFIRIADSEWPVFQQWRLEEHELGARGELVRFKGTFSHPNYAKLALAHVSGEHVPEALGNDLEYTLEPKAGYRVHEVDAGREYFLDDLGQERHTSGFGQHRSMVRMLGEVAGEAPPEQRSLAIYQDAGLPYARYTCGPQILVVAANALGLSVRESEGLAERLLQLSATATTSLAELQEATAFLPAHSMAVFGDLDQFLQFRAISIVHLEGPEWPPGHFVLVASRDDDTVLMCSTPNEIRAVSKELLAEWMTGAGVVLTTQEDKAAHWSFGLASKASSTLLNRWLGAGLLMTSVVVLALGVRSRQKRTPALVGV